MYVIIDARRIASWGICGYACCYLCKQTELREYLSVDVPPREKVVSYLTNIGEVYAPDWTPSVTAKTLALACVYCAHLRCVRGWCFLVG